MKRAALAALIAAPLCAGAALAESHEQVTVTHAYSFFGEAKYGPDMAHLDYVNPDAPKGGEISVWAQGNFDSFNNFTRKGVAAANTTLMTEDLMISVADDPYATYCYLCETMEYPEDLSWLVLNLRDDVTFRDGTPMTAEDVKFTVELFLEQGLPEFVNVIEGFITGVTVEDTHRIRFDFSEEAPIRDRVGIAGIFGPFSKAWFEQTGARIDESTLEPFMATGPYQVGEVDVGRRIVYERNPNWWGAGHPLNVGLWNFDRIRVEYFADSAAALEGFKAGVYTFRDENSSKEWATSYDFPAVQDGYVIVEELPDGSIGSAQAFVFNLKRDTWQDPRVRDAMRLVFNFEWSNETLFYGLYERTNSFWANTEMEAKGAPGEDEIAYLRPLVEEGLLDASILTDEAAMAPVNDAAQNTPGRRVLREAAQLLTEAGWEPGPDGIRSKDGQRLTAVFLQRSPAFDRIVNPYIENLRRIGVDAKLERVDNAQYIERSRSGDWDLINHTLTQGYEPSSVGLSQWFASTTADDSSRNLMALADPAIDRLIENFAGVESLEEMQSAARALDRALRAEGFWVQQWFKDVHTVAYWDQYRYPEPLPPLSLGTLDFWWYDAEAAQRLRDAGAL